ncbi:MAG: riboflavin synthase [Lachnospiraceae bacterium]
MFTGIIEEVGHVKSISGGGNAIVLGISCKTVLENTKIGDSIAVNGVCLTVTKLHADWYEADVMPETMHRTVLGNLKVGSPVNLERAMAADGRFGGHIVSGHIDGTGTIQAVRPDENAVWFTIAAESELLHYIVEKGSICIDGISLTVADVTEKTFSVSVIPHTRANTSLSKKDVGDDVNLECDIIGKYVEKLLFASKESGKQEKSNITMEFLMEHGYS